MCGRRVEDKYSFLVKRQKPYGMQLLCQCVLQQVAAALHIVQNRYCDLNLPPNASNALPVTVAVNFDLENVNTSVKSL
jgi:hypothetical protein